MYIEPDRKRSAAPGGVILILIISFAIMGGAFGLRYYRTLPSVQLMNLLEEAQAMNAQGRTQDALTAYMEVLEMDPSRAEAYRGLMEIYNSYSDYAAITNLIRSLPPSVSEEDASALRSEAIEYIASAATANMAEEDYEGALSLYRSIVAVAGSDLDLAAPARNRVQELEARLAAQETSSAAAEEISVTVVDRIETAPVSGQDQMETVYAALMANDYIQAIQQMSQPYFQSVIDYYKAAAEDGYISVPVPSADVSEDGSTPNVQEAAPEIRIHLAEAEKTFTVSSYDGTQLTVSWPPQRDENGHTVLGIYGKDRYGFGTYVMEDGTTMTSEEYLGLSN